MFGKHTIIDFFLRYGIHQIFYLPGIHTLSLSKSFLEHKIDVLVPRHESTMAFMADGFARVSGKTGVVVVTPGPGLGNVVTGCMEAYGDDVPLLIIHIDTGREDIGKGILHELVEPESVFRNITKQTFSARGTKDFAVKLEMAYHTANKPRKGPVLVSLPYTLLEKEVSSPSFGTVELTDKSQDHDLAGLAKLLDQKRKPLIIGGKSLMVEEARPVLDQICNNSSIPFLTTTSGKGILDEHSPWCFGNVMQKGVAREMVSSADLVIALGTRLRDVDAKRRGVKIRDLVHLDIDDTWIDKNYSSTFKEFGEIRSFLKSLKTITEGKAFEWPLKTLKQVQHNETNVLYGTSLGFQLIRLLSESLPEGTMTVWDLNLLAYWAEYYYPVRHQRTFVMPRGVSPIFYALPAAIGASAARPEKPCLAVCGDGGILPLIGEFATVVKYNIPLVTFVLNNHSFGILEDYMRSAYSLQGSMDLVNPDFVRMAQAFGIEGQRAETLSDLKGIFRDRINWKEPFLIEFVSPVFAPPWRV